MLYFDLPLSLPLTAFEFPTVQIKLTEFNLSLALDQQLSLAHKGFKPSHAPIESFFSDPKLTSRRLVLSDTNKAAANCFSIVVQ